MGVLLVLNLILGIISASTLIFSVVYVRKTIISVKSEHFQSFVKQNIVTYMEVLRTQVSESVINSFKGQTSGAMRAMTSALESEGSEANPQLSFIDMVSPGALKKLNKNPLAMMGVQAIIGKVLNGGVGNGFVGNDTLSSQTNRGDIL